MITMTEWVQGIWLGHSKLERIWPALGQVDRSLDLDQFKSLFYSITTESDTLTQVKKWWTSSVNMGMRPVREKSWNKCPAELQHQKVKGTNRVQMLKKLGTYKYSHNAMNLSCWVSLDRLGFLCNQSREKVSPFRPWREPKLGPSFEPDSKGPSLPPLTTKVVQGDWPAKGMKPGAWHWVTHTPW